MCRYLNEDEGLAFSSMDAFIYEIDNLPNIRDNKLEVGFKGEDLCFLENTLFGAKMGDMVDIPINQLIIKYKLL